MQQQIHHGVVHGRTIQLDSDPGLSDGVEVEIFVRAVSAAKSTEAAGSAAAGMMAPYWSEEDDRIHEQIERDRAKSRPRELEE